MTYAEERRQKAAEKAKRSKRYRFEPVPFDVINPPAGRNIAPGTEVVKITMTGAPSNGTMGMCYVGDPETGDFIGLVMLNSLVPVEPVGVPYFSSEGEAARARKAARGDQ